MVRASARASVGGPTPTQGSDDAGRRLWTASDAVATVAATRGPDGASTPIPPGEQQWQLAILTTDRVGSPQAETATTLQ